MLESLRALLLEDDELVTDPQSFSLQRFTRQLIKFNPAKRLKLADTATCDD